MREAAGAASALSRMMNRRKIEFGIAGRTGKAALDETARMAPEFDRFDIGLQPFAFIALQGIGHRDTFPGALRQRARIQRGFQHSDADMGRQRPASPISATWPNASG